MQNFNILTAVSVAAYAERLESDPCTYPKDRISHDEAQTYAVFSLQYFTLSLVNNEYKLKAFSKKLAIFQRLTIAVWKYSSHLKKKFQ